MTDAKHRFRWAVCQLDALKRLKCERHIVMKALKNLPNTLEKTYDRIFTTIPEQERLFVHHVLRWIAHHNELYEGEGIPCEILIQAAVASTIELTGEQNERFYDKDTLWEICGCLVDISSKDYNEYFGKPHHTYFSVTFAHYTVREYLDSGRISKSASANCATDEGIWTERFIEITMSEAQNLEPKESWSTAVRPVATHRPDIAEAVCTNLTDYCLVSSIYSLYQWSDQICRQSALRKLAVDLLDPSKPHFETMIMLDQKLDPLPALDAKHIVFDALFRCLEWCSETSTEAKQLCLLLLLYQCCTEYAPLVKAFLQERDHKHLLQTRLIFKKSQGSCFSYREWFRSDVYFFDG